MKKIFIIPILLLILCFISCGKTCDIHAQYKIIKYYEEPTCTDFGNAKCKCLNCGEIFDKRVSPLGHDNTETIIIEGTCTKEGLKKYSCNRCNNTYENSYLADHNYKEISNIEPTCKDKGYKNAKRCTVCNSYSTDTTILETVDHTYVDGKCIWCDKLLQYKITYVYNDEKKEDKIFDYGSSFNNIILESSLANTFLGWYDENGILYDENYILNSNLTVYAKFTENIIISTKEEFLNIKNDSAKSYILANDIDLDNEIINPINVFTGRLDGNGYTISNFVLKTTSESTNYGMFNINEGSILNISFDDFIVNYDIDLTKNITLGVIVGLNKGKLENVHLNDVTISIDLYSSKNITNNFGGLVGKNLNNIKNCTISAECLIQTEVYGYDGNSRLNREVYHNIGGLVGLNSGNVESCLSTVKIDFSSISHVDNIGRTNYGVDIVYNHNMVGALVGTNQDGGNISKSFSNANITYTYQNIEDDGKELHYLMLGGLVGCNLSSANIKECFSNGHLDAYANELSYVGGLVGSNNQDASVSLSYSNVTIESLRQTINGNSHFGGLVGYNNASIVNSYSNGSIKNNKDTFTGGLAGTNDDAGVISKCYSNTSIDVSNGTSGKFVGLSSGIISKSYAISNQKYYQGSSNDAVLNKTSEVSEIELSELINESFLTLELSWKDSWYISGYSNPILRWEIESTIHSFDNEATVDATCEVDGFRYLYCEHCETIIITEIIEALGHERLDDVEYDYLAPTHETDGYVSYLCIRKHENENGYYNVVLPALGHNNPDKLSCEEETVFFDSDKGQYYYLCDCNNDGLKQERIYVEDDTIIIHNEIYVDSLSPNCGTYNSSTDLYEGEAPGHTNGIKCLSCEQILSGCEIILPHNYKYIETMKEATCQENGIDVYQCTLCNKLEHREVNCTFHEYDSTLKCIECNSINYEITYDDETDNYYVNDNNKLVKIFPITNLEQLKNIESNPKLNYFLANDIDLEGKDIMLDCDFEGIFHGNGYTISNLNIKYSDIESIYSGLFRKVSEKGVIVGLTIQDIEIVIENVKDSKIGIIACENYGVITNCNITSTDGNSNTIKFVSNLNSTNLVNKDEKFNFSCGFVSAVNYGNIEYCNILGNISYKTSVSALYKADFDGLLNLNKSAKVINNTTIIYGSVAAINEGNIINSNVLAPIVRSSSYEPNVDGVYFGQAIINIKLYEGSFVGINYNKIDNCSAIQLASKNFHDETGDGLKESYGLETHLEVLNIKDYTVYETYKNVIGHSSEDNEANITIIS